MGQDEIGRDQQWKISWEPTNMGHYYRSSVFPSLSALCGCASLHHLCHTSCWRRLSYNSPKPKVLSSFYICSTLHPKQHLTYAQKCIHIFQPDNVHCCNSCFRGHHPLQSTTAYKQDDCVVKDGLSSCNFFSSVYRLIEARGGEFRQMGHEEKRHKDRNTPLVTGTHLVDPYSKAVVILRKININRLRAELLIGGHRLVISVLVPSRYSHFFTLTNFLRKR